MLRDMKTLFLAVLVCICFVLYGIWLSQMEIFTSFSSNLHALNVAMFMHPDETTVDAESFLIR